MTQASIRDKETSHHLDLSSSSHKEPENWTSNVRRHRRPLGTRKQHITRPLILQPPKPGSWRSYFPSHPSGARHRTSTMKFFLSFPKARPRKLNKIIQDNQVFHIIQYIVNYFYPPKFLNSPLPTTSQVFNTPPKIHPHLQLKTHYLINFSNDINHLIHHFVHRWGT